MIRIQTGLFILTGALAALVAGCGPAPQPATPTAPPPTIDLAAPRPSGSASAAPSASAAADAPPPPPDSPFGVIARLPSPITIAGVDGALVVLGGGFESPEEATAWLGADGAKPNKAGYLQGFPVGVLVDGKLRFPRTLLFESLMHEIVGAVGRWPNELYILTTTSDGRTPIAEPWLVSERRGYQAKRAGELSHMFIGAARVGASSYGMSAPSVPWGMSPTLVDLASGKAPFAFTPASKKDCWDTNTEALQQQTAVTPSGFGATAEGQLLSVGPACEQVGVEVWKPGSKTGTVTKVPKSVLDEVARHPLVLPAKDHGAWIVSGAAVLRWDGAAATRIATPDGAGTVKSAAVGPDGALYLAADGGVFRGGAGGWEPLPLPVKAESPSVAVANGQVYVASGNTLLRLGAKPGDPPAFTPTAQPLSPGGPIARTASPTPLAGANAPKRPRFPGPGSAKCAHNVVLLYAFTKVTPDDYDFPLTRKAIKGHAELAGIEFAVVKENGKKFFSGLAPSFEAAKKLQALIAKQVKDSSPQIFCSEPEVVRELAIDLRTGEVAKK